MAPIRSPKKPFIPTTTVSPSASMLPKAISSSADPAAGTHKEVVSGAEDLFQHPDDVLINFQPLRAVVARRGLGHRRQDLLVHLTGPGNVQFIAHGLCLLEGERGFSRSDQEKGVSLFLPSYPSPPAHFLNSGRGSVYISSTPQSSSGSPSATAISWVK